MPEITFTSALQRHVPAPPRRVSGTTVRQALDEVFQDNPRLRGYVLDEQGRLRPHVHVYVDGEPVTDRERLSDPIGPSTDLYVAQALSGG
jgi:molybdopterin synthase sulfur carrier subunit